MLDRAGRDARDRCVRRLQEVLRPAEVHVTGSMGKSTALRGEHDMDVVVVTSRSRDLLVQQLRGAGFKDVRVQRPTDEGRCLIVATYGMLSLDILPVTALQPQTWAHDQVRNKKFYAEALLAWKKNLVVVMKALYRLKFAEVPGVLLEAVVHSLPDYAPHGIHGMLLEAFAVIQRSSHFPEPAVGTNVIKVFEDRRAGAWLLFQSYTRELCSLTKPPLALNLGDFCQQSLPCGHQISLQFEDVTFTAGVSCNRRFVDTVLALGLQIEDSFAFCGETNHLRDVTECFLRSASCRETARGIEVQSWMNKPWPSHPPYIAIGFSHLGLQGQTDEDIRHFDNFRDALAFMAESAHRDQEVELHFSRALLRGLLRQSDCTCEESLRASGYGETAQISRGFNLRFPDAGFNCCMWLSEENLPSLTTSLWDAEQFISRVFGYRYRPTEDGVSVKIEVHKPCSFSMLPSLQTTDMQFASFPALVGFLAENAHPRISVELSFNIRLWLHLATLSSETPTVSKELRRSLLHKAEPGDVLLFPGAPFRCHMWLSPWQLGAVLPQNFLQGLVCGVAEQIREEGLESCWKSFSFADQVLLCIMTIPLVFAFLFFFMFVCIYLSL